MASSAKYKWNPFIVAWILGLLFYFLEYAVRSAPSVMIPDLAVAFSTSVSGVSTIIGAYYITYSITSLAAGVALDKAGAKYPLFIGTLLLGAGCFLFVIANYYSGYTGRLLQGMGSAMAFPACVYIAAKAFSPKKLATAIGATQSLGMLGGSAGQFLAVPMLKDGMGAETLWIAMGIASAVIGMLVLFITPADPIIKADEESKGFGLLQPYRIVFSNRQSYLCGIISGLLFAPTTIFAMTWGVAFFQTDRHLDFETATLACAVVPFGWAVGCPLLGWIADRIKRRKPVIAGGGLVMILSLLQLLYLPGLLPAYISTFIMGVASGAAMIPYSVIKESNPDTVKGSATGAINFVTFGVTSLLGPLFNALYGVTLTHAADNEAHFRNAGLFWLVCVRVAICVSFALKETGQKNL